MEGLFCFQEPYWRIPSSMSPQQLTDAARTLRPSATPLSPGGHPHGGGAAKRRSHDKSHDHHMTSDSDLDDDAEENGAEISRTDALKLLALSRNPQPPKSAPPPQESARHEPRDPQHGDDGKTSTSKRDYTGRKSSKRPRLAKLSEFLESSSSDDDDGDDDDGDDDDGDDDGGESRSNGVLELRSKPKSLTPPESQGQSGDHGKRGRKRHLLDSDDEVSDEGSKLSPEPIGLDQDGSGRGARTEWVGVVRGVSFSDDSSDDDGEKRLVIADQ